MTADELEVSRRLRALDMKRSGASCREIGAALGLTRSAAWKLVALAEGRPVPKWDPAYERPERKNTRHPGRFCPECYGLDRPCKRCKKKGPT